MLVTLTYDEETGIKTIDKSYNEIVNALNNGIMPIMQKDHSDGTEILYTYQYGQNICDGINVYYVAFDTSFYSTDPNTNMTSVNPCGGV